MMVDSKAKGSQWERELVKIINKNLESGLFKRVPGSGALGTTLDEPSLTGDVVGKVDGFHRTFKLEAKVGYGGSKSMTIQKGWLDKIAMEASATRSIPAVVCRFSGSRSGVENFVLMDLEVFIQLLNHTTELYRELEGLYESRE